MVAKHVGISTRLGPMKAHSRRDQFGFVQIRDAVYTFLQALGFYLFHLLRLGVVLLQAHEPRFPLRQFSVGQRDVLDDGIALIFVLELRGVPIRFRRIYELAERRVEDRTLGDDLRQCRRVPFDRERISNGIAEAGAGYQHRHVAVAEFPVGSKGALDVGIGDRRSCVMRESSGSA